MTGSAASGLRFHTFWLATGWGLVATVVYLSLTPGPPKPFSFHWSDKLEHLLAYGLLMGWFMQIYAAPRARAGIALALALLGVLMELLQALTAHRTFDLMDMAANSAGVLLTWILLPATGSRLLFRLERRLIGP